MNSFVKLFLLCLTSFVAAQSSSAAVNAATATAALSAASTSLARIGDTGGPAPLGVFQTGTVKTFNWEIGYVSVTRFNTTRRMIGANGKWPFDRVTVDYNDTFILNVKNNLDKPTSIHFHGIFQFGTPDMDGATFVTQCPIPPGGSWQYKFNLLQWGTYWIHAHIKGEYVDGLRAPFVINPPRTYEQPAAFDEETVISISDWYNEEHPVLLSRFLGIYNPSGAEPVPNGGLLNEKNDGELVISSNKTYKFRFVSFAALVTYDFYIEGHDMYVVEVDGVDSEPTLVKAFPLAPAQRVAVIVKSRAAGNGTDVNYLIHAVMESTMFENPPDGIVEDVTMNLVYNTSPTAEFYVPTNDTIPNFDEDLMDETELSAWAPLDTLELTKTSSSFFLDVSFQVYSDGVNHGAFNTTPFMMSVTPSLYTAQTIGDKYVNESSVYGALTIPLMVKDLGETVEIIINNGDSGKHPFHLHGHAFQVLVLTDEAFDPANPYPDPLPKFPMRRDTINIPGGGHAIIRFQSTNPGTWLLHCHIEWHFEAGLAVLLIEAPSLIGGTIDKDMEKICKAQGIPTTGNAAGNKGLDMSGYMMGLSTLPTTITATGWGAMVACAISSFIGVATVIWFAKKDPILEQGEAVPSGPSN
ncbi:hypothetical protein HDU99_007013 [Rhizoclosmatium hyalinum]|nr:hypothetical protein HDU99_007013 [Rhizoclosmatium hyalinum]